MSEYIDFNINNEDIGGTTENPSINIPELDFSDISVSEAKTKLQECRQLLNMSAYEEAYKLTLNTIDSYLKRDRDDYGCIIINDNEQYPLDNVNTYYTALEKVMSNNDAVYLFYAELTGQLAELKISRVQKVLSALEQAYKDLKDITDKNQALAESIINGWKDDSVLSIEEQNQLKQKYIEITAEYEQITDYVVSLINIYDGLIESGKTAFIKEDAEKYSKELKEKWAEYDASYEKIVKIAEYYLHFPEENKNEFGGIPLNPDYDVTELSIFYTHREKLLNIYYEANSFYTNYNRFGSKLVYIGEDGIYAGAIMGDQIQGWNIEGLTIGSGRFESQIPDYVKWKKYIRNAANESEAFETKHGGTGPGWQLREYGDGHIAGGQISWTAEGNVTLGDNVKIEWKNVNGKPEGLEEADKDLNDLKNRLGITDLTLENLKETYGKDISDVKSSINTLHTILNQLKGENGGTGEDEDGNPGSNLTEEDVAFLVYALTQNDEYCRALYAGIGTFIEVKAHKIVGDVIAGKTLQCTDNSTLIDGTIYNKYKKAEDGSLGLVQESVKSDGTHTGPTWQLKDEGDGYLAKGNIRWDANGKVTFGPDVTLEWNGGSGGSDGSQGVPGISFYKSIVFTRTNTNISTVQPKGGSWDKPWPDDTETIKWFDGIPPGDGKIWMSYKIFKSDNSQTDDWSNPKLMIDSESFEVAYATAEAISNDYAISAGLPKDGYGNAVQNENGEFEFTRGWTDEPDPNGDKEYVFMATANCDNGKWGKWTVSKIKGENGNDGTGLDIKAEYESLDEFKDKIAGSDLSTAPSAPGDAYLVKIDGVNHLYVWISNKNEWVNQGPFSGIPGPGGASAYIHEKYAVTIIFKDNNEVDEELSEWTYEGTYYEGENSNDANWYGYCVKIYTPEQLKDDNIPDDPDNFDSYHWSIIDINKNLAENITTKLSSYKITTNTIAGKTFHSTETGTLAEGTTYFAIKSDGTFATTLKDGKDVELNNDKNPITKETDTSDGPLWQIGWDGSGHLAAGNIRWTPDGTVKFGPRVKLSWDDNIEDDSKPEILDADDIKNTVITKDYINTLDITAKDISATTIQGKTIKSSENEWEIQDGGTAIFANNRVCFNADGSGWIGKRDNGMAVLSWKEDGTIESSNTTMYDVSESVSGAMAVNPSTLYTDGIFLCSGDVQLKKMGADLSRANMPAGVYTFVNTTNASIQLTLPRFNNYTNRGLVITIPAWCGADVRFVYNSTGQFEFIPLVGSTVEEKNLN